MDASAGILPLLTLLAGACFFLYGIVLSYHWIRYSESWMIATFSVCGYIVAGLYLLALMAGATMML